MKAARSVFLLVSAGVLCAFWPLVAAEAPLVIGRKPFVEQDVVCEILRQHLALRLRVPVQCAKAPGDPDSEIRGPKPTIDMYVEYTGTAFVEILKHLAADERKKDSVAITKVIRDQYKSQGLLWLDELGYDSDFVMVIRKWDAMRLGSRRLSDAVRVPSWRVGSGPDFQVRADGLAGLLSWYDFKLRTRPVTADVDALFRLLQARAVDMIAANGTDPQIDESVEVMEDDRRYFPKYRAAIVLRKEVAERHPTITNVLGELKGKISLEQMRKLLERVQRGPAPSTPESVAAEFLSRLNSSQ
jgi:glycine betaine/choline ABC-type transport system substrate-binding protein